MKIEKLPSGSYRIRKTIDKKTHAFIFDHKPTKKEIEASIADAITAPEKSKEKRTFYDCAVHYISINSNTLKPSTRRSYEVYTRTLSQKFLNLELRKITQEDVQTEINDYSSTHSPKSVRNAHGFISRIITFYRPEMVLKTNLPAKQIYEKYVPTPEEVDAVLRDVEGTEFWVAYRLALYGLRRGELMALTIKDLTPDNRIIISKAYSMDSKNEYILMESPKTTASFREITIDQKLADQIRKQGHVYQGSINELYKHLIRVQKRLGQPHWRFHDFRAYMATELSQAGFSEADIIAIGGWSSAYTMKDVYRRARIQKDLESQKKAASILSREV